MKIDKKGVNFKRLNGGFGKLDFTVGRGGMKTAGCGCEDDPVLPAGLLLARS
jgi:hypothetical protein